MANSLTPEAKTAIRLSKSLQRSVPKKLKWAAVLASFIIVAVVILLPTLQPPAESPTTPTVPTTNSDSFYPVIKVIDGDTIEVDINNNPYRVRLIGVDTPEVADPRRPVQCFGQEASAYTSSLLQNQRVQLVADPTQDNIDKYGRLLRYVYLENGQHLNYLLISEGYAYEYTFIIPYQQQSQFKQAQQVAEKLQKGLWNPQTCNGER